MLHVEWDGETYDLDLDDIDVSQGRQIKRQTGLSLLKFQEGLMEVDTDCVVVAYWLMMAQNGKAVDMNRVNFKVVKFTEAIIMAAAREKQEQEERDAANPTGEPTEAPQPTTQG
jgi:hypothetical protein